MAGASKALSSISVFVELSGFSDIIHPLPLPHPCLSILWVAQTVFSDTIYILLGGERATTTNWEIEVFFPIILHNRRVARLNNKATSSPTLLCYFNWFINWCFFYFFFFFISFIRGEHYLYKFTKIGSQEAKEGYWWKRTRIGSYFPPVTLRAVRDYLESHGWKVPKLKKKVYNMWRL